MGAIPSGHQDVEAPVGVYTLHEPICYSPRCAPTFGTNRRTDGVTPRHG